MSPWFDSPWFDSPAGQYLLAWEQSQLDLAVVDVFGYHALQLGLPPLDALRANRMPHRWLAIDAAMSPTHPMAACLVTDFGALPFPAASLDLVVLPHTLEQHPDPHATLREVARVLMPEGRVVLCGMNPWSLWGWREQRARLYRRFGFTSGFLPPAHQYIHPWRVRDWLQLLDFEVAAVQFGAYRPAVRTAHWLDRFEWMDKLGPRWWRVLGATYCIVAVKRVRGMRLLEPGWKTQSSRAVASAPLARRAGDDRTHDSSDWTTS